MDPWLDALARRLLPHGFPASKAETASSRSPSGRLGWTTDWWGKREQVAIGLLKQALTGKCDRRMAEASAALGIAVAAFALKEARDRRRCNQIRKLLSRVSQKSPNLEELAARVTSGECDLPSGVKGLALEISSVAGIDWLGDVLSGAIEGLDPEPSGDWAFARTLVEVTRWCGEPHREAAMSIGGFRSRFAVAASNAQERVLRQGRIRLAYFLSQVASEEDLRSLRRSAAILACALLEVLWTRDLSRAPSAQNSIYLARRRAGADAPPRRRTGEFRFWSPGILLAEMSAQQDGVDPEVLTLAKKSLAGVPSRDGSDRFLELASQAFDGLRCLGPSASRTSAETLPAEGSVRRDHGVDFFWVCWDGKRYEFNRKQQRAVLRILWEDYECRGTGVSESALGRAIKSSSDRFRLCHVFREKDGRAQHEAWGTLIQTGARGIYRLPS